MDSWTSQTQQGAAVDAVSRELQLLNTIKTAMPQTYEAIQRKAQQQGNEVFGLVRRGLRGESGCFWAMEAGHVVGTPFEGHSVQGVVAEAMVRFGCAHVCIIAEVR